MALLLPLALLTPLLVLPLLLAVASFEDRCRDGSPLLRRRRGAEDAAPAAGTPAPVPVGAGSPR